MKSLVSIIVLMFLITVMGNLAVKVGAFENIKVNWVGLIVFFGLAILLVIGIVLFEIYENRNKIRKHENNRIFKRKKNCSGRQE